ncbi:hypothetical protein ACWFMI_17110 [Nocardiopsis terrae]
MTYVTAALCTLVRLLRPCGGLHADPSGYLRTLAAEYRRRSRRVRRYTLPEHTPSRPDSTVPRTNPTQGASNTGPKPTTAQIPDQVGPFIPRPRRPVDVQRPTPFPADSRTTHPTPDTPRALLPTFRVSHGHTPAPEPSATAGRVDLVRTYYRAYEQHTRATRTRAAHTRTGHAV